MWDWVKGTTCFYTNYLHALLQWLFYFEKALETSYEEHISLIKSSSLFDPALDDFLDSRNKAKMCSLPYTGLHSFTHSHDFLKINVGV